MQLIDIICLVFLALNVSYLLYLWTIDSNLDESTKSALSIGLIGSSLALIP